MFMLLCLDVYLAIDWLILECTDGNQRNEISSLFNALLLWDISIWWRHCEGTDPSRNEKGATKEWCKKNEIKTWCEEERAKKGK